MLILSKIPFKNCYGKYGISAISVLYMEQVHRLFAAVSFTVSQAIAVAEDVKPGLTQHEKEGKNISTMGPVCTVMVGRLDDSLKATTDRENIIANPEILEWAGVATMKKAYQIYPERRYHLRLLSAAFRNHFHWSQFINGNVMISPPYKWQQMSDW